uniref:Family with sequence similarity 81 member B n=1 Tax=Neogobius melanostomus TaxID=47308 RepID=A0A8C6WXI3_9GOBI
TNLSLTLHSFWPVVHVFSGRGKLEYPEETQDKTLAVLLEQAFRIKDEVAASLQCSQGCVHTQTLSHKLLESHILTITRIVKQLSLNIQTLERQIAQRDSAVCGTTRAVQWLDHKNMAGIGDLRGRVASAEVNSSQRQVLRLQQEVTQLRSAVDAKMNKLQVKVRFHTIWKYWRSP